MTNRRKELQRQYAQTSIPKGVYRILNKESGKMLIAASPNLQGSLNRERFMLQFASHTSKDLQHDWNRLGEDAFAFEVLEELKPLENGALRTPKEEKELLTSMEKRWTEQLVPNSEALYKRF